MLSGCGTVSADFNIAEFEKDISGISSDTRSIVPGSVFICMKGTKTDSHEMIGEISGSDASVVMIDNEAYFGKTGKPTILVDDSRRALAYMWSNFCGRPERSLRIVAVTGTNGKSSTVAVLRSIFETAGYKCAFIGTVNMPLTTPDPDRLYPTLKKLAEDGTEYVFMEASSHALYFDKLAPIVFDGGIFTNLTPEHLDFHGGMDTYADAKAKLFSQCRVSVINADSIYSEKMISAAKGTVRTFSADGKNADYSAENIKVTLNGAAYDLCSPNGTSRIRVNCGGGFNVENTLAAAALADSLGIGMNSIAAGIEAFKGAPGRFEEIPVPGKFRVFIDYAHTPDALEKLLSGVNKLKRGNRRLVTVFGCGGDRDKTKRAVMGRIASTYSDFTIITSDNSRSENPYKIIADIMEGFDIKKQFVIIADRRQAIEYAVNTAARGDIILLCGKGHEDYEIDETGRHPFSEKEILKSLTAGA